MTELTARLHAGLEGYGSVLCQEGDDLDGEVLSRNELARIIVSASHLHKRLLHKLFTGFEELLNCTQHDVCLCVMDGILVTSFVEKLLKLANSDPKVQYVEEFHLSQNTFLFHIDILTVFSYMFLDELSQRMSIIG